MWLYAVTTIRWHSPIFFAFFTLTVMPNNVFSLVWAYVGCTLFSISLCPSVWITIMAPACNQKLLPIITHFDITFFPVIGISSHILWTMFTFTCFNQPLCFAACVFSTYTVVILCSGIRVAVCTFPDRKSAFDLPWITNAWFWAFLKVHMFLRQRTINASTIFYVDLLLLTMVWAACHSHIILRKKILSSRIWLTVIAFSINS